MKLTVHMCKNYGYTQVTTRCPHCGTLAVMSTILAQDVEIQASTICGQRKCPSCSGHLFFVKDSGQLVTYPPVKIAFDPINIPTNVLKTFEEGISCHAGGMFIAAAIMVRRTLEDICANENAQGNDLKQRIADFGSKITLPKALLEAMNELRILGNDAAHIEAKEYNNISDNEVKMAIRFTKEILKALYQYKELLSDLRDLKNKTEA